MNEDHFLSRHLRICALCLGDILPTDQCTWVDTEISCLPCAELAEEDIEDWDPEYEMDDDWDVV